MSNILRFPQAEEPNAPHIIDLPFVRDTPEGRRFWCVEPSGDYRKDYETGCDYARQALEYAAKKGMIPLIGWVIADMSSKRGAIEVGFVFSLVTTAMWVHRARKTINQSVP